MELAAWLTFGVSLATVVVNTVGLFLVNRQLQIKNEHDRQIEGIKHLNILEQTREKQALDEEKAMRERRMAAYLELEKIFQVWNDLNPYKVGVDLELIRLMLTGLSNWYTNSGALILSETSRKAFHDLTFTLQMREADYKKPLIPENMVLWANIRNLISDLEKALLKDLDIRNPPPVAPDPLDLVVKPKN